MKSSIKIFFLKESNGCEKYNLKQIFILFNEVNEFERMRESPLDFFDTHDFSEKEDALRQIKNMKLDNKSFCDKLFNNPLYANYINAYDQKNIYAYNIIGDTNIKTEYLKRLDAINPITKINFLLGEIDLKVGKYKSLLEGTSLTSTTGDYFKEFYTKKLKISGWANKAY